MINTKRKNIRNYKYKSKKRIYKGGNPALAGLASRAVAQSTISSKVASTMGALGQQSKQNVALKKNKPNVNSEDALNDITKDTLDTLKDIKDQKGVLEKSKGAISGVSNITTGIINSGIKKLNDSGLMFNDIGEPYIKSECRKCMIKIYKDLLNEDNKNNNISTNFINLENKINSIYLNKNNISDSKECNECFENIKLGYKTAYKRRVLKNDPDKESIILTLKEAAEAKQINQERKEKEIEKQNEMKEKEKKKKKSKIKSMNKLFKLSKKKNKLVGGNKNKNIVNKNYYLEKYYKSKKKNI